MTGSKKVPGMISDPWRSGAVEVKPKPRKDTANDSQDPSEDWVDSTYTTVALKGYGGITIETKAKEISPGAYLLKFCVDNLSAIDDILIEYGVLVDKTTQDVSELPFYIQRNDGWCLAIPEAHDRDAACLQLIQAFLKMYTLPKIKFLLTKAGIVPYVN